MTNHTAALRSDRRRERAYVLQYTIMHIVSKYVAEDRERDCMRDLQHELFKMLYEEGVEIVTDLDRTEIGLPPRGPDGWTNEELIALEKRRLEVLYAPIPPILVGSND